MRLDRIEVRDIRARGRHGVLPEERAREREFVVDLALEVDARAARSSDDLADTVDYASLHAMVVRTVEARSYALLERLGAEIVAEIMRDARVRNAEVRIAKPGLLDGATPAVVVREER